MLDHVPPPSRTRFATSTASTANASNSSGSMQRSAAAGPTDDVVTSEGLSELYGHHVDVVRVHGRVLVVAAED